MENPKEENRKEIEVLKKIRRNIKHKILFSSIFALFCIVAIFMMLARSYLNGENADNQLKTGTYEYQLEDTQGGVSVSLRSDGTFTYCESWVSSYIGEGTFTVDGDILRLRERNGAAQYFLIEENRLSFIEKGSKNFKYVPLTTGAVFTLHTNI